MTAQPADGTESAFAQAQAAARARARNLHLACNLGDAFYLAAYDDDTELADLRGNLDTARALAERALVEAGVEGWATPAAALEHGDWDAPTLAMITAAVQVLWVSTYGDVAPAEAMRGSLDITRDVLQRALAQAGVSGWMVPPSDPLALGDPANAKVLKLAAEMAEAATREHWGDDTHFPVEQWQMEVGADDTRLGYRAWVLNQYEGTIGDLYYGNAADGNEQ